MTGADLRVGIMTPHAAPGPELELPALTEGRVTTVVCRVGSPTVLRDSAGTAAIELAARIFPAAGVDVVAHASTTTGYVIGAEAEAALVERLADACGVPAVASCAAAISVLRAADVERLQLVHPPWFADEFDALGLAYFAGHGFDVTVTRALELPHDPADVRPGAVVSWVERHLQDRVGAVFLAGTGFRTAGAAEEVARRTGRMVVSANGALLTAILASG